MTESDLVSPRAFEDVYVAFYEYVCRKAPGIEQRNEPSLVWVLSGIPHPMANAIVRSRWTDEPVETLRELIATTLRPFQMRQVPATWFIWPSSGPADLGEHLLAAGLAPAGSSPLMAYDVTLPPPEAPLPPRVRIERVRDAETFAHWVTVLMAGFEFPESQHAILRPMFDLLGYDDPVYSYLAWLDGEPVATATLFLHGEIGGIFNVATLPEARGKGIGSAITAACLHDAREATCRAALLNASAKGLPVYQRLGFETVATLDEFVWWPESAGEE